MMSFAIWKKRSKLFNETLAYTQSNIERLCAAAFKAGERDGLNQAEAAAEYAIKFKELIDKCNQRIKRP